MGVPIEFKDLGVVKEIERDIGSGDVDIHIHINNQFQDGKL